MTKALPKYRALSTDFTRFWHLLFSILKDSRKKHLYHNWDQKPTHLVIPASSAAPDCKGFLFSTKHTSFRMDTFFPRAGGFSHEAVGTNIA
jgi:hypothetical protein